MASTSTGYTDQATTISRSPGAAYSRLFTALLWLQGLYYFVTGIWPLISIETFQMVTGQKTDHLATGRESDHWLVMTVGTLIAGIAVTLLVAAWRRRNPLEMAVLALVSALGLAAIDVIYVARQVILPIYLADAAAEAVLIAAWLYVLVGQLRTGGLEGT